MSNPIGRYTGNPRGIPTRELESLTASVAVTASYASEASSVADPIWIRGLDTGSAILSGSLSTASGDFAIAEGLHTITTNDHEHAEGKYNATASGQIFSIGIGTDDDHRQNAIAVNSSSGVVIFDAPNGLDVKTGDFYLSGAGEYAGDNRDFAQSVQEVLKAQTAALIALAAGAKVTLTISPSVIYKNVPTTLSLVGTLSNVTPSSMRIFDGMTEIAYTESSARIIASVNTTVASNSKPYRCEALYEGVPIVTTTSVNARYPIYYGFGATFSEATGSRLSARTSAAATYTATSTADGQHFYIMVPSDITDVNGFAMGGAPFVMNGPYTEIIGGITYKVHESGVAYNRNTTVNVVATV